MFSVDAILFSFFRTSGEILGQEDIWTNNEEKKEVRDGLDEDYVDDAVQMTPRPDPSRGSNSRSGGVVAVERRASCPRRGGAATDTI